MRSGQPEPKFDLSPIDLEIMQAIWAHEPASVRQVYEVLKERKLAQGEKEHNLSTVATYVERLCRRDFLGRDELKVGREFMYRSLITKEVVQDRIMRKVTELYDSESDFLHCFANAAKLTVQERQELEKLAKRLKGKSR